jgi:hypothetical protein
MSDLRAMIREILSEELAGLRKAPVLPAQTRDEVVSIRTNAELAAFVKRLLSLAQDSRLRADIETGRHVFRLATGDQAPVKAHEPLTPSPSARSGPVRFETGLITEKEVASLPDDLRSLSIAKSVRFTPLARDELRRRGVKIERTTS